MNHLLKLPAVLFVLGSTHFATAESRQVTLMHIIPNDPRHEVTLTADEQAYVVSVIDATPTGQGGEGLGFRQGGEPSETDARIRLTTLVASKDAWKTTPYVGPLTITLGEPNPTFTYSSTVTLLIVGKGEPFPAPPAPPQLVPTAAVVIPTDAVGPVQIVLESSVDMVTWTAATPGTYGASTEHRFFRVRAITQSETQQ